MLSVVLYGRNDNHGYNYHKRLAISLNCIAEVLSDAQDEILFADYNTPDEFPTIIEAIYDTLTDRARRLIRIFRIRPRQHRVKVPLPVIESIARNVAIRRSNPLNRWILSTNTDMIFVPTVSSDLNAFLSNLPDGFYLLPRISIPEALWEQSLKRLSPQENIDFLKSEASLLHLNTIVRRPRFLKYDNPGDFQLMLRDDIFAIQGFDETMTQGWHVDSNLCKRMDLLGRGGDSIENHLKAFHCNHNLKETLFHAKVAENDWGRFIDRVETPKTLNDRWGLADEEVEEISLRRKQYEAVKSTLQHIPPQDYQLNISFDTYNTTSYVPSRLFAALVDHLTHLPKETDIAYIGMNLETAKLIDRYLKTMGFTGKFVCCEELLPMWSGTATDDDLKRKPYLMICDFGDLSGQGKLKKVVALFLKIVQSRKEGRFIGINVLHTDFNPIFSHFLITRHSGHSTGVVYGIIPQTKKSQNLISILHYWVVRFVPSHADRLRRLLAKTKWSARVFKTLR